MGTKRVLNRIRLDKIAAVDKPCQEPATVAIVKRAPGNLGPLDGRLPMIKATFAEALNGAMVSESVRSAFWNAFDGLWQRNDAFREALTDELTEGGDGSIASADYIASINSLVDEAVAAARSAGASASDGEMSKAIRKAATAWVDQSQPQKEPLMTITNKAALATAVASFAIAKSTASDALAILDAAEELDAFDVLDANPDLAKMADGKRKKKGEDDKAMKSLQREVAVLKMSPDGRTYFEGLDASAQDAFLAKSAEDQNAEIEAANATDPVVYKCADGTQIRKSDGAAAAIMAKRLDAQDAEIAKLRQENAAGSLEKRANAYPNVAREVAEGMLKSLDSVGADTDAGKGILKSLDAMNKAGSGMMKRIGSTDGQGAPDMKKARNDFETEVEKVARERKIAKADAMSAVRTEQPELFAAAYPETVEMDEAE